MTLLQYSTPVKPNFITAAVKLQRGFSSYIQHNITNHSTENPSNQRDQGGLRKPSSQ